MEKNVCVSEIVFAVKNTEDFEKLRKNHRDIIDRGDKP